jgi:hypothetical protein
MTIIRPNKIVLLALPLCMLFSFAQASAQQTTGTKRDVEKRLKAVEKSRTASPDTAKPLDQVVNTLFAVHGFEQVAVSPDGAKVAWVETLFGKDGMPSGNSAIYVKNAAHSQLSQPCANLLV